MKKIGLIASFILLASIIPNAFASGADYEDKEGAKRYKDGKYDKDEILEKLKKLYNYELICDKDGNIPLGSEVTCEAIVELKDHEIYDKYPILKRIVINLINDLHIRVIDPEGKIVLQEDIPSPKWKDNSKYDDNPTKYIKSSIFSFTVDKPGEWEVKVKFTSFGYKVKKLYTSFFVLPESPLGAIAVVGSSIAVLALFINRQRKNNLTV